MPLAAMFILFESIVHDPTHSQSKDHLLFLDMAAGYFGRLEYESGGGLQGSIFSEFTLLAREFVRKEQNIDRSVPSDNRVESTHTAPSQSLPLDVNGVSSRLPLSYIFSSLSYYIPMIQKLIVWVFSYSRVPIDRPMITNSSISITPFSRMIQFSLTSWMFLIQV